MKNPHSLTMESNHRDSIRVGKMGNKIASLTKGTVSAQVAIDNESAGGTGVVISKKDLARLRVQQESNVELRAADEVIRNKMVRWIKDHEGRC